MGLKFGLRYASLGRWGKGPAAVELAQAAEEAGFESIWTVEHVVVPKAYQSRYPYSTDGRMGMVEDFPIPDPIVWMSFVASVTTRIKLGTAILIVPQRNPVVTAKALATLDDMAGGGRVLAGIGVGWLEEEFTALGIPFADRGARTDEYVGAWRTLWSQDCATFEGEFVNFRDVYCNPRPLAGSIPIIVGGDTKAAARRAGRLGDGYFPARGNPVALYAEMRAAAEAAGRDPDSIEISAAAPAAHGDIDALVKAGVGRVMVPVSGAAGLPPLVNNPDEVLRYGREVIARYQ
jgi:probable F420-dependent oxidoreductase